MVKDPIGDRAWIESKEKSQKLVNGMFNHSILHSSGAVGLYAGLCMSRKGELR